MAYTPDEQELYDFGVGSIPRFLFQTQRAEEVMGAYVKMFDAARAEIEDLFDQTYILNATGSGARYLDQHASERVGTRSSGESDVALRERIRTVQDALTRSYLLQIAQDILDADSVVGTAAMVELRRDKAYVGDFGRLEAEWGNGTNVTITGNDIQKTGGSAAWDAGCYRFKNGVFARVGSGAWYLEWEIDVATDVLGAGFYTSTGGNFQGLYTKVGGTDLEVYKTGAANVTVGTQAAGDVLRIVVNPATSEVTYWQNGTLLYTDELITDFPHDIEADIYTVSAYMLNTMVVMGSSLFSNGIGGVFTNPSGNVMRFEPYELPWARPPFDERPPDYAWQLILSGADEAGNDGTFEVKAMNGDAAEYTNVSGVADSEDLGVEWETKKLDQDLNVADGFARAFVGRGYRVSTKPPISTFVIILPYGTSADTAASVEAAIRRRKAAGFKLIVERRLNP